jgi:hypothetical protein
MQVQPYYIVPLLIEQPTWGGKYIAEFKSITDQTIRNKKIGQAYELAAESLLTGSWSEAHFLYSTATSIDKSTEYGTGKTISLADLIASNPESVLGKNAVAKHGITMPLLIKFTQALSNSYQVHVEKKKTFKHWLPKPESWYFFEKGKATLGLKAGSAVTEYKARCEEIDNQAKLISQQIKAGKITLDTGTQQLFEFRNTPLLGN